MGKKKESTQEYKDAMSSYNQLNEQYQKLADQYTGNAGYQNSLNQASQGAGIIAQNQAAQTQTSARNAGMNKAQAAAMGANTINSTYGNNFANQQQNAMNSGLNALSARNTAAQNYLGAATTEGNEENNRYGRKSQAIQNWTNPLGSALSTAGSVATSVASMSDERCKVSEETPKDISKCLADIDAYIFKYKNKPQEEKPCLTDDSLHIGVMAQELEQNPVLKDVVHETEDGLKTVDTQSLTMTNTALLSDLAKRLERLEQIFPMAKGE